MELAIVIILVILAIGLFLLEIFLLPGISIAGIAGGVLITIAVWFAFASIGTVAGVLTLVGGLLALGVSIWLFLKMRALERMSLTTNVTGKVDAIDKNQIRVGDRGMTLSRLAPMGKVVVNNLTMEAKTYDDFIDQDVEVIVKHVNKTNILVEKI